MPSGQNVVNLIFNAVNNMGSTMSQIQRGFQGVTNAANAANAALGRTNQTLNNLRGSQNNTVRSNWSMYNSYKGLVGQVTDLNRAVNIFGASIRQVGQGLQNFGTVFSIFVSVPVGIFIRNMLGGLIELQHQMIEVRKTTGMTTADMEQMQEVIQKMSLSTPTSALDLAKMAADWGRLGITAIDNIAMLTQATDMFVIATNVTAEDAVTKLGRIGNIFYDTTEDFVANINGITSAIVALGNTNAVMESEIISSFLRIAPYAEQLGIALPDALALATTVSAVNVSPERAGTQLSRALVQIVSNNEKIAKLTGLTTQHMEEMINLDPGAFFLDLIIGIGQIESRAERLNIAEEVFGGVGSRAALGIMSSVDLVADNIALARFEYERATAAQTEFNAALDSVQNQVAMLGNNFKYLGYTIAAEVMPYITKFSAMLIPILLAATDAFKALDDRTKMWIIAIGLIATALGPVLIMLGTLMFSLGIITTGMSGLVNQLLRTVSGFSSFGRVLLGVIAPTKLIGAAVVALAGIFVWFGTVLGDVGSFIGRNINAFFNWGFTLFESFADGIMSATGVIMTAISGIIGVMASFLQGFSPPKEGPLSEIDKWGQNVGQAFIDGFSNVDVNLKDLAMKVREAAQEMTSEFDRVNIDGVYVFGNKISDALMDGIRSLSTEGRGMFSDVFGTVTSIIQTVGKNINLTTDAIEKRLMRAASVVKDFVSGGGGLGEIAPWLGGMAADIEKMVNAQNAYNQAQEDTKRIREQIENLDDSLDRELRAIAAREGLSLDERAAAIRTAKLRAQVRKDDLEDQEKASKQREESLRDEASAAKDLIGVLTGLIFPATKLPELKGEDDLGGIDFQSGIAMEKISDAADELNTKFEDLNLESFTFLARIDAARERLEGFFAALRGEELTTLVPPNFLEGFAAGLEVLEQIKPVTEMFNDAKDSVDGFFGTLGNLGNFLKGGILMGFTDGLKALNDPTSSVFSGLAEDGENLTGMAKGIYNFGVVLGWLSGIVDEIAENFAEGFFGTFDQDLKDLKEPLQAIAELLAGILVHWIENMPAVISFAGEFIGILGNSFIAKLKATIFLMGALADGIMLLSGQGGDQERMLRNLEKTGEGLYDVGAAWIDLGKHLGGGFLDATKPRRPVAELIGESNGPLAQIGSEAEALASGMTPEEYRLRKLEQDALTKINGGPSIADNLVKASLQNLMTDADISGLMARSGVKLGMDAVGSGIGQNIIDGVRDFFSGTENEGIVTTAMQTYFRAILWNLTGNSLDDEIGEPMAANILKGIIDMFESDEVTPVYGSMITSLKTWLEENINSLKLFGADFAKHIVAGIKNRFTFMSSSWYQITFSLNRWFTSSRSSFTAVGTQIGDAITNGIISVIKLWPINLGSEIESVLASIEVRTGIGGNISPAATAASVSPRNGIDSTFGFSPIEPQASTASLGGGTFNFDQTINGTNLSEKQLSDIITKRVMKDLQTAIRNGKL